MKHERAPTWSCALIPIGQSVYFDKIFYRGLRIFRGEHTRNAKSALYEVHTYFLQSICGHGSLNVTRRLIGIHSTYGIRSLCIGR